MTSPSSGPRGRVIVTPVNPEDIPALAACELLAVSGAFPPALPFAHLANPFRAPLARAGVSPQLWPDFASTVRRRRQQLRDGALMFKAVLADASGDEHVVGMAKMLPPRSVVQSARRGRKWKERVLGDYVYPAVDSMRGRMWQEADGTNHEFMKAFRTAQIKTRDDFLGETEYFYLKKLFVHPSFQQRGAGSALLAHCAEIADAASVPLVLEASPVGTALYAAHGFSMLTTIRVLYRGEVAVELPFMRREPAAKPCEAAEGSSASPLRTETETEMGTGVVADGTEEEEEADGFVDVGMLTGATEES